MAETQQANEPKKLVWIQLAQVGSFKGHPQGAFTFTPQVFDTIVQNFRRDGLPIPIDAEHASEMKPTDGSIPSEGAPAMGWIHALDNRGNAGLWGAVEWLEPARTYIKEGRYRYISPAVRFKSKDRVSGKEIGPRLSSAGITNSPFLPGLKPLCARNEGEAVYVMSLTGGEQPAQAEETISMGAYCYSSNEYMPAIRSALGLHGLSTAQQCSDHLGMLREHFAASGGDASATQQGIRLADHMLPLRDLVRAQPCCTWDEVFDAVQDLIDAAIDEHEIKYHEGGDGDAPALNSDEGGEYVPAAPIELTTPTAPAAAEPPQPSEAAVPASAQNQETITMSDPVSPAVTTAPTTAPAVAPGTALETTVLTLRLQTAEAELETLRAEHATLLAWKEQREEADLATEVSVAFETHKDRMKLKADQKPAMLSLLKADPDNFRKMYPPTPMAHSHLLRNIAGGRKEPTEGSAPRVPADNPQPAGGQVVTMSLRQLSREIQRKEGLPLGLAQQKAARIINQSRKRAG